MFARRSLTLRKRERDELISAVVCMRQAHLFIWLVFDFSFAHLLPGAVEMVDMTHVCLSSIDVVPFSG
jgi:hypothetical protein